MDEIRTVLSHYGSYKLEQKTLNTLRLVVPGAIILLYAVALGAITKLFSLPVPDIDTLVKSVLVLVIGVIYRFTPLRSWINRSFHNRVNENIRSRMVAMAGLVDAKDRYTWNKLRRVFYDIVDHDESLKVKGQRVMFNGLIWTSCADVTAIGILFLGYSLILIASHVNNAVYAAIAYFCCALLGFIGSIKTTEKHIELGNEQLDLMEEKYASQIRERLETINA